MRHVELVKYTIKEGLWKKNTTEKRPLSGLAGKDKPTLAVISVTYIKK